MAEGALGPGILGTDIPGVGLGESVRILSKAYRIAVWSGFVKLLPKICPADTGASTMMGKLSL